MKPSNMVVGDGGHVLFGTLEEHMCVTILIVRNLSVCYSKRIMAAAPLAQFNNKYPYIVPLASVRKRCLAA